jgi:hypothetical protein
MQLISKACYPLFGLCCAAWGLQLGTFAGERGRRDAVMHAQRPADLTPFGVEVDLGAPDGVVTCSFAPFFSSSELLTFRYPLPFELEAAQRVGFVEVVRDGYGLRRGDILRAFSTFEKRWDSKLGRIAYVEGLPGVRPGQESTEAPPVRELISAELGGFWTEQRASKVLFVADGQSLEAVTDALQANTPEKTDEIVMLFERQLRGSSAQRVQWGQ